MFLHGSYLDKETGDFLNDPIEQTDSTEPSELQNPNETTIVWASQEKLYEIDWCGVWYELEGVQKVFALAFLNIAVILLSKGLSDMQMSPFLSNLR